MVAESKALVRAQNEAELKGFPDQFPGVGLRRPFKIKQTTEVSALAEDASAREARDLREGRFLSHFPPAWSTVPLLLLLSADAQK